MLNRFIKKVFKIMTGYLLLSSQATKVQEMVISTSHLLAPINPLNNQFVTELNMVYGVHANKDLERSIKTTFQMTEDADLRTGVSMLALSDQLLRYSQAKNFSEVINRLPIYYHYLLLYQPQDLESHSWETIIYAVLARLSKETLATFGTTQEHFCALAFYSLQRFDLDDKVAQFIYDHLVKELFSNCRAFKKGPGNQLENYALINKIYSSPFLKKELINIYSKLNEQMHQSLQDNHMKDTYQAEAPTKNKLGIVMDFANIALTLIASIVGYLIYNLGASIYKDLAFLRQQKVDNEFIDVFSKKKIPKSKPPKSKIKINSTTLSRPVTINSTKRYTMQELLNELLQFLHKATMPNEFKAIAFANLGKYINEKSKDNIHQYFKKANEFQYPIKDNKNRYEKELKSKSANLCYRIIELKKILEICQIISIKSPSVNTELEEQIYSQHIKILFELKEAHKAVLTAHENYINNPRPATSTSIVQTVLAKNPAPKIQEILANNNEPDIASLEIENEPSIHIAQSEDASNLSKQEETISEIVNSEETAYSKNVLELLEIAQKNLKQLDENNSLYEMPFTQLALSLYQTGLRFFNVVDDLSNIKEEIKIYLKKITVNNLNKLENTISILGKLLNQIQENENFSATNLNDLGARIFEAYAQTDFLNLKNPSDLQRTSRLSLYLKKQA